MTVVLRALFIALSVVGSAAFLAGGCVFRPSVHSSDRSLPPLTATTVNRASLRLPSCLLMSTNGADHFGADTRRSLANIVAGVAVLLAGSGAVLADGSTQKFSLPPISNAKDRCVFKSSAMGQANAARDKLYDLRQCDLR